MKRNKGRRDWNVRGGFRYRSNGQPVVNMANRMNRSQFLRTAGLGAAGLGAAAYGMSGVAHPCPPPPPEPCGEMTHTLWAAAGRDDPDVKINVGSVRVWHDENELHVIYTTTGGWCLGVTHLWVGTDLADLPMTPPHPKKSPTPVPGHFPFVSDKYPEGYELMMNPMEGCVTEHHYTIPYSTLGIDFEQVCDELDLIVVPHAEVEKTDCEVTHQAPYPAISVYDSWQGQKKDGGDVNPGRSVPEAVLTWDTAQNESSFFSLGFGGWIILKFDCCISNGVAPHLVVVEDTWGTGYHLESADVYGSISPSGPWEYLGQATNSEHGTPDHQTVSYFDLSGFDCIQYIKIVDTTDKFQPNVPNNADGYDLNTVLPLNDCEECTTQEETAWGGDIYTKDPRWWYHFMYPLDCCEEIIYWPPEGNAYIGYEDRTGGDFDYNDFGMSMQVQETYVNNYLSEITMTFVSKEKKAGDVHDIHITRTLDPGTQYNYTITRTTTAQGTETAAGTYPGASGDFDVVLFDSQYFTNGDSVTIHIEVTTSNDMYNPSAVPPRFDLPSLFAFYDPWMHDKSYGPNDWHIGDMQSTTKFGTPAINVPYIIVAPVTAWNAPAEGQRVNIPYPDFDDYYRTLNPIYAEWYL
jgi:hypothetical protein